MFTVKLSKFAARAKDVETKLAGYNPTVTATTTESAIQADIAEQLTSMELANIRIQVSMVGADEDSKVNITITIIDLLGDTVTVEKDVTITASTPDD